jgi:lysophospholipase L1-like esterase
LRIRLNTKLFLLRIMLVLTSTLICISVLEIGSKFILGRYGSAVDKVVALVRPDSKLLWRQRSNFDGVLWGQSVLTDAHGFRINNQKTVGKAEVLLLGPSSAFGWGVAAGQIYGEVLATKLGNNLLNASQIGYSIAQGAVLIKQTELNGLSPKLVIVAYGINDIDRFRFYNHGPAWGSDREHLANTTNGLLSLVQWLLNFYTPNLLNQVISKLNFNCGLAEVADLRVNQQDFLLYADQIRQWSTQQGAKVVFLSTPLKPDQKILTSNDIATDLFISSAAYAKNNQCALARRDWELARLADPVRIYKQMLDRNHALQEWCKLHEVSFVDIASILVAEEDFVDTVHPSALGHQKVASAIYNQLQKR